MKRPFNYILVDRQPVAMTDWMEWALWMENTDETGERTVGRDKIGDLTISTVFLGIDHQYGDGPPVLFETLVFWNYAKPVTRVIMDRVSTFDCEALDETLQRYTTWEKAEAGHKEAVRQARLQLLQVTNGGKE